jgi:succinoglycan biosynthesis transport protein ExoP
VTLLDFVRLTRANWRLIFVVASMGLIVAFLWTLTRPVSYASVATAQVKVGATNDIGQLSASLGLSQKYADIYAAYVSSGPVRDAAAAELGIRQELRELLAAAGPS